uniref:Carbohydrate kinase PfkB domain-containing protein n=1 Tax=Ditylum brightwellii TaxID=49249 RepID=A0A7S4R6Z7_9STRA|mmetsp:Transcript_35218/g.53311  ORF Transcript_35218/g.53311 Transcript_35218/m.53311 type:complete len:646 (+) Transcript_35218:701-2638(+)
MGRYVYFLRVAIGKIVLIFFASFFTKFVVYGSVFFSPLSQYIHICIPATTVASTMHLAHLAGISTFVTGGTGGVHRGGELSLDISSDLTELSKTPVVVISAGIKSILDIQKTLETLETLSVPTATYQSDEYPSFFSPHSGIQTPHRVENATEVANVFLTSKYKLKLSSGMLIAVPNTHPAGQAVENAIQESLNEVKELQIVGKDVTPYILKAVSEKTKGESLLSNIELVKRNAKIGADIAIAICKEENKFQEEEKDSNELHSELQEDESNTPSPSTVSSPSSKVIVMGGIVMDLIAKPKKGLKLILSTSNPGICFESDGGVGRNIAEVLGRLGAKPLLYSAIGGSSTSSSSGGGGDSIGQAMIARLTKECGVVVSPDSIHVASSSKNNDDTNNTHKNINSTRTATYLAILDHNSDLNVAIADMDIFQHIPIPSTEILQQADALVLDANPPLQSLVKAAINATSSTSTTTTKVFLDPTSVPKARIIGTCDELLKCISYAFPNLDELLAMADGWTDTNAELNEAKQDGLKTIKLASEELLKQMDPTEAHLIITLGCDGVMLASKKKKESNNNTKEKRKEFEFIHFPAKEGVNVENSTGAGDTLCGAFINGILNGKSERESVQIGMDAAILSLQCPDRAISPKLGRHF